MKFKKINKIIATMVLLTTISIGLFTYQNFFIQKESKEVNIFLAKGDIPAQTKITNDMFKIQTVSEDSLLEQYVTDINEIVGKELKGGLLENEPLCKTRLSTVSENKNNLEIKLEHDISVPLNNNDYVNVYVSLKDSQHKVSVQKLFDNKQIIVTKPVNTAETSENSITIKVDEKELVTYYDAKEKGKIIIAKSNDIDGGNKVVSDKYTINNQESQTSIKDDKKVSLLEKTFEKGDTLENLSVKYKTNKETIIQLNDGKKDFKEGDKIIVPSN